MAPNQQKGFSAFETNTKAFEGIPQATKHLSLSGKVIFWALKRAELIIEKLIILAKYQFYKHTSVAPSRVGVPWGKLSVVGMLLFMSFKHDLSFSVGVSDSLSKNHFGNVPVVEEASLHLDREDAGMLSLFTNKAKADYFADSPNDNNKDKAIKAYIRRFKDVAVTEKEKFGIPASIKLAQAIIESNAGQSSLSSKNNNHFGIKCFSRTCKKGHCSNFGDDSHKDFFRKYGSAWESWRAHSQMIVSGRYKPLLKHGNDYRSWAKGLKNLGYATAKHYEQTLIEIIEKYHLYTLD